MRSHPTIRRRYLILKLEDDSVSIVLSQAISPAFEDCGVTCGAHQ